MISALLFPYRLPPFFLSAHSFHLKKNNHTVTSNLISLEEIEHESSCKESCALQNSISPAACMKKHQLTQNSCNPIPWNNSVKISRFECSHAETASAPAPSHRPYTASHLAWPNRCRAYMLQGYKHWRTYSWASPGTSCPGSLLLLHVYLLVSLLKI
jgi:hypothetical protein